MKPEWRDVSTSRTSKIYQVYVGSFRVSVMDSHIDYQKQWSCSILGHSDAEPLGLDWTKSVEDAQFLALKKLRMILSDAMSALHALENQ
jgi:hypothetical protein